MFLEATLGMAWSRQRNCAEYSLQYESVVLLPAYLQYARIPIMGDDTEDGGFASKLKSFETATLMLRSVVEYSFRTLPSISPPKFLFKVSIHR